MKKYLPLCCLLLLVLAACSPASTVTVISRRVLYSGSESGLRVALDLAGFSLVSDPAQAEVFVLNGDLPVGVSVEEIASRVQDGAGLVLVPGDGLSAEQVSLLLGQAVSLVPADDPISLTGSGGRSDALETEIIWNGAPQVRERFILGGMGAQAWALVSSYEDGEGILYLLNDRNFVFTPRLSGGANPQVQEWGYFNYLVYHLVERAAGGVPLSFADYPASPVPHAHDQALIFAFLGAEMVFFFGAFVIVRRYSLKHPEALASLVGDRRVFETREDHTSWDRVGFHRPLSGLFVGMGIGLIMFIPLIIYQNLILPQFILPSAQALGMWGRVTQFFGLTWAVFDLGTAMASMKFLSQHRVSDPVRAFKYMQVFVWWQALSGAIQVALVVAATTLGIVRTPYALFAWSIVIHSLIQIPGFLGVYRSTLNALQRADYARLIDASWAIFMPMLTQLALVPLFYAWGKAHPAIGASMGGVIGLGAAAYAMEVGLFLLGMGLYRRIGLKAGVVFLAHFDWGIIKETFRFGFFEMLGGLALAAGGALEIWVTQNGLVNYSEMWGNWLMAGNFLLAFTVSTNLFDGVMPAVSEALAGGYRKLSQYYSVQSYKWGAISSASLGAILLVVAPRFILGSSGEEFQRAAVLAIPLTIFGSIQFLSWLGDAIFLGANRPFLRALMVAGEQVIRIGLLVLLLVRFQITALVIASFAGILVRGLVSYFVAHRYCFPQRFYFWQSLAAPLIAAGLHYLFLSAIARFVWQQDEISSIVLFFIGLLPAMPFFFFFYALAGGWDEAGLQETVEASRMTGVLRPFINAVFILPSRWGARLSPLHNRFPISMRAEALEEARRLTEERVRLARE